MSLIKTTYARYRPIMGQLDDIESDLTPLKKSAKFEIGFYDHFIGLGESFIIINHHKPS